MGEAFGIGSADDHDLGCLLPLHLGNGIIIHPALADGIPMDIQHHLNGGIFFQHLFHRLAGIGVGTAEIGLIKYLFDMNGGVARRLKHLFHRFPHRNNVFALVGGVGAPLIVAITFGGMGMNNKDLRVIG